MPSGVPGTRPPLNDRPDLLHLPTTNGEHCTGDGIKMSEAIGAKTIDLEWVQVHPTGLVKPDEPDAKVKFLAAEALRGVGGLVLDANGKRFANELGRATTSPARCGRTSRHSAFASTRRPPMRSSGTASTIP